MDLTPYDKLTPGERAVVDAIARNRRHGRIMAVLMALTALLLLASAVFAQSARVGPTGLTGTTCPGSGCLTLGTQGLAGIGVQVTGSFSGTLTFEASIDNATFVAVQLNASDTGANSTTTTTTGAFSGGVGGFRTFRVRFSNWVSGTAAVTIQSAPTSAKCVICAPIVKPTFLGLTTILPFAPDGNNSGGQLVTLGYNGDAAVHAVQRLRRDSQWNSGTPTIGDGAEVLFQLRDTNGNYGNIAGIDGRMVTVAPSTMIGRLELNAKASGTFNTTFDDVVAIVDGTGVVGIGSHWQDITLTPTEMLHVYDGNVMIEASGTGGAAGYKLKNNGQQWNTGMGSDKGLHVFDATGSQDALVIDATTRATHISSGILTAGEATITTTGNATGVTTATGVLRCNNATALTIQGLAAGQDGQVLRIISVGAGNVNLSHQNTSETTAANRLINTVTSADETLVAGKGAATYVYDGTTARWRMTQFEQGDWITPAFAAGNYTGSGSMTVTVDSADEKRRSYYVVGRTLNFGFQVDSITIGGTRTSDVIVLVPGGYTVADDVQTPFFSVDNGTFSIGRAFASDATHITVNIANFATWAASTNNTSISGFLSIPIN